jgi:N-acetyl-gamma-glutamyl-phosphate reductase
MDQTPITAAIVGATGYVGAELTRLLLAHPRVSLEHVTSRSRVGTRVDALYPHLEGRCGLVYGDETPAQLARRVDALFLALPHGASIEAVASLFEDGAPIGRARVIDMSGDFRLEDPALYEEHYGVEHLFGELLGRFVYGLSEWNAEAIAAAQHVANPGCFATAIGLALAPLAAAGLLPDRVTAFAATGSTGSGASASKGTHHPERATNYKLYKVLRHQHVPEIETMLASLGAETRLSMVPASAPMTHGIFATLHLPCDDPETLARVVEVAYADAPFVRVRRSTPQLNWVVGSNFADIGLFCGDGELVVASALDNTLKGAAGQAVQNLNLMFGFEPTRGLGAVASLP